MGNPAQLHHQDSWPLLGTTVVSKRDGLALVNSRDEDTGANQSLCVKTPDTTQPEERISFNLRQLIGVRRCFSTHGWRVRQSNQDDEEQENGCGCPEKKVGDIAVEVKKEGTDQI